MSERRRFLSGLLWVSPWLIGGTLFLYLPMAMSLWYSLTDYPLLKPPVYVGLDNYRELFADGRFRLTAWNTLLFAGVSIPLSTLVGLAIAGALSSPGVPGRRFLLTAVFVPTLVPAIAGAMIWLWIFNARYGLLNQSLAGLGIPGPNWLEDRRWAMPALVLASLWGVGQSVVIYVQAIGQVPAQLYEAADIDGMSAWRRFRSVTLPMISPAILFNVVTLTIGSLQVFVLPFVLFRNERGQRNEGYFYTMYMYDNAFVYQKMGYASAMAWLQLLAVLALTAVLLVASRKLVYYRAA